MKTPTLYDHPQRTRFVQALSSITPQDRVVLIHDADADGITSMLLLFHFLQERGVHVQKTISHLSKAHTLGDEHIAQILDVQPTHIISTDLDLVSMDGFSSLHEQVSAQYIVQDHHAVNEQYAQLEDFIYVNPIQIARLKEGAHYCSAKIIYDLLHDITDMSHWQFLAAIGILGDRAVAMWADFLLETATKQGMNVCIQKDGDWYETPLAEPLEHIMTATALDQKTYTEFVSQCKQVQAFAEFKTLPEHPQHQHVREALHQLIATYQDVVDYDATLNLYILQHDTPYTLSGQLCTLLSYKQEDALWLVIHPEGDTARCHMRNQSQRIHCGHTLRRVCAQLDDANGGGHGPAAGARIHTKDIDTFITLVKQEVQQ